jgi:hypothetical protein
MKNRTKRYYYPNAHYPPKYPRCHRPYDPYSKASIEEASIEEEALKEWPNSSTFEIIFVAAFIIIGCGLELIFPGIILRLAQ